MASSDESLDLKPDNIIQEAEDAVINTMPVKSKLRYMETYEKLMEWKRLNNAKSFSENVLLDYFNEQSKKFKPSSLWAMYSMLKTTLKCKQNIDIKNYPKLSAFLKRQSDGFKSKKSKVLTAKDVNKFLNEAPDGKYLVTKVALIFGVAGACRREELTNITVDDIENHGEIMVVKIPNTKTKIHRSFVISGQFYTIVKKYESLRVTNAKSNRFFQAYLNGKCKAQCIGINKFGSMPKEIATYLQLPNPELYTGHSFRRTSATWHADAGADLTTLKRHGGWRSNNVSGLYIEDSTENKIKIASQLSESVVNNLREPVPETSILPSNANIYTDSKPSTLKDFVPSTNPQNINTDPTPSTSKDFLPPASPENIYTDPLPSTLNDFIPPASSQNETFIEDINQCNMSQTVEFGGKTINLNLQNCKNVNFYFKSE